jgi:hypothetical protein
MLHSKIKIKIKKKPQTPRVPPDAVRKLRSHPVIADKGTKAYDRRALKKQDKRRLEEENS